MKVKPGKIALLIEEIHTILNHLHEKEQKYANTIAGVQPGYERSARNLIHYIALRSVDMRDLQKKLGDLGLSRLTRAEAHVKASLFSTRFILHKLTGIREKESMKARLSIKKGEKLLKQRTKALLGNRPRNRRLRIMVTLPSEAAHDYALVHELAAHGMNCARINCAHDDAEAWKNMIAHVKKASQRFKRNIKITMDLAGPKIRTGTIKPGPRVRKFSPIRDNYGKVTQPAEVWLVPEIDENSPANALPIDEVWLKKLKIDDIIVFKDTRNKDRLLKVKAANYPGILCHCSETTYVATGTVLNVNRGDMTVIRVGELPALPQVITLKTGDTLVVHKESKPGEPAYYSTADNLLAPAHISCSLAEVFGAVKVGESIFFDDGKIQGIIKKADKKEFVVEITHAKEGGSKLGADKGINLPHTNLNTGGLTAKDKEDLAFIVKYADVVNFSFVNTPEDVKELLEILQKLNALDKIGIILKIETQKAYNNLKLLLLAAMKAKHVGVMIARGDLAIEAGWENIGKIQREILSICNAAHIPVVWATQVLEHLAKKGLPSRAEITDAVTSLNAECVMLNKGPYIVEAMQLLHIILSGMEEYQDKNATMLPELEKLSV